MSKSKNIALKAKSDEKDELSEDEDAKLKSCITRQFKKFIKNANAKGNDKDRKQSVFSQFKSQDKTKREAKDGGLNSNVPSGLKCYGCQGYRHMKQECPTFLKFIGKSKALAVTLSDMELEAESDDSDQEGIISAFTATIDSPEEAVESVDEEEELMEPKLRRWMN